MICNDVETGGLDIDNNQIFTLGMLNMENGEEFYQQCRYTHGVISDWSLANLKIDFEDKTLPTMQDVEDMALAWLDEQIGAGFRDIPCGHNWHYDDRWITRYMPRLRQRFVHRYRDTAVLGQALIDCERIRPWKNLKDLCDVLGVELEQAHHAMADVRATAGCWRKMVSMIRA